MEELFNTFFKQGYTSIDKLYAKVRSKGYSKSQVKEFLLGQENVRRMVMKPRDEKPKGGHFMTTSPWAVAMLDIMHVEKPNQTKDVKYILVLVDVFSKYVYLYPLKNKTKESVKKGLLSMLPRQRPKPMTIVCDRDSAWTMGDSKDTVTWLLEQGVQQQFVEHAPTAERMIRTLREGITRLPDDMTYWQKLAAVAHAHNDTVSKQTGMKPDDVMKLVDDHEISPTDYHQITYLQNKLNQNFKRETNARALFNVGDRVRVIDANPRLKKSRAEHVSKAVFEIVRVLPSSYELINTTTKRRKTVKRDLVVEA